MTSLNSSINNHEFNSFDNKRTNSEFEYHSFDNGKDITASIKIQSYHSRGDGSQNKIAVEDDAITYNTATLFDETKISDF